MRRGIVIGIVAGAAVLVAGGAITWWLLNQAPGPEAVAQSYLDALEQGDAARAVALLDAEPADLAPAFEGASAYIDQPAVESVRDADSGGALADVSFSLDGEDRTASLALIETSRGWRVAVADLGSLTATTTIGDAVGVGAATLSVEEAHILLPALYPVSAAPKGLLEGATSAAVVPGEATTVSIEATIADGATAAAQTQLDAYAEQCTLPAVEIATACGIRIPWEADLTAMDGVTYRVEQTPQVAIAADGVSFAATNGVLVATVRGPSRAGGPGEVTYRTDAWSLYGSVAFTGNEMTLSVR